VRGVLERAREVLGAAKRRARLLAHPYTEGGQGEIDLEATLERWSGRGLPEAEDLVVRSRQEKRLDCALMVDTSLSMEGKNIALAGTAAAVLATRLNPADISVILFENRATVVKPLGQKMQVEELVGRILDVPATGYTNIHDALRRGAEELSRSRRREQCGILITDGKYTVGGPPLPMAGRFRTLHVLMTEDYTNDPTLCRRMAATGHGHMLPVRSYEELPRRIERLLVEMLR
jgi:Mg-chelatase subunit ChlD